jgi:hypothetical protein
MGIWTRALAELARERVDAVQIVSAPFFDSRCARLAALAAQAKIPGIYTQREYPEAGEDGYNLRLSCVDVGG